MTRCTTLALLAFGSTAIGCATEDNLRLVLGDEVTLASLPPKVPEPVLDADGDPAARPAPRDDQPSIDGLARSDFVPTDFIVPIDGTRHQPEATRPLRLTDATARQRGEFPTAAEATQTGGREGRRQQALEMLAAPFWAFGEALIMPAALIIDPFFETVSSPDALPGRSPTPATGNPGVLTVTPGEDTAGEAAPPPAS
ncbi:MAG: hypothetical protein ACTS22_02425 [Phycisphaerales bacterium]